MTVPVQTPITAHVGNGVTTVFAFGWFCELADDLVVKVDSVEVSQSEYSIAGLGDDNGGTVTFLAAPASLASVVIIRRTQVKRDTDYQTAGDFRAQETVNPDFDRLWRALQDFLAGNIETLFALRVPAGETVDVLPAADERANKTLTFDADGNAVVTTPAAGTAGALAADLGNNSLSTTGAGMIGNDRTKAYGAGTVGSALQLAEDGVNVLHYLPPAEWAAILAGTATNDHYAYLQAALTAERHLMFPAGRFNTSQKLIPRSDSKIRSRHRRGTKLRASGAFAVLEFPYLSTDVVVENIRFQGPAGYTGIAMATTAGAFQGYLIQPKILSCDFDYATSGYGINADLIYGYVHDCTFGYYSEVVSKPAIGAGSFCGIRSYVYPATSNYTSMNTLSKCKFDGCGKSDGTVSALDLSGGTGWAIRDTDFSFGGRQITTANIQALKFEGTNWFEGNDSAGAILLFGTCTTPIKLHGANFSNNTCLRLVQASISNGDCAGIDWAFCEIGKTGATSFCFFDTVGVSTALPANGKLAFYKNQVSGGAAGDKLVTATDFRGGALSPRFSATVDTSGSGTLLSCTDPSITLSRSGAGDVTLSTPSMDLATTADKVQALVGLRFIGASSPGMSQAVTVTTTSVRVRIQNTAGANADGTFSITVFGA